MAAAHPKVRMIHERLRLRVASQPALSLSLSRGRRLLFHVFLTLDLPSLISRFPRSAWAVFLRRRLVFSVSNLKCMPCPAPLGLLCVWRLMEHTTGSEDAPVCPEEREGGAQGARPRV